jgi:hypothetical protein
MIQDQSDSEWITNALSHAQFTLDPKLIMKRILS